MAIFTKEDFLTGRCRHQEIGTNHEPRWATVDADRGLCSREAVGTYREVVLSQGDANAKDIVQQALNQVGAQEMAAYLAERLDIMAPKVAQLGLSGLDKTAASLPDLKTLTEEQLNTYSSSDIKRMMLKAVGCMTPDQAAELFKD